MEIFRQITAWLAANESVLSAVAALTVIVGLVYGGIRYVLSNSARLARRDAAVASDSGDRPASFVGIDAVGEHRYSLSVLRFKALSTNDEDEFLASGITSEVIAHVTMVPNIRVSSRLSSYAFRTGDADIVIVDSHDRPGGHWNDAYPFVRLHQPSAFYGVSSRDLGSGRIDDVGLNRGLYELASGAEVSAYFDAVMQQQFLPSGRVRYFPMSDYLGDGRFRSRLTGEECRVRAGCHVDATWLKTSVPSTHTPAFTVADDVRFVTPNALVGLEDSPPGFVIVGGGKTGIDTALWLLERGVDAAAIRWIMPRDAWLLNRRKTQPGVEFFEQSIGAQADQMAAIAEADSVDDLFSRLEAAGVVLRIDRDVLPRMFHGATVSEAEVDALRRIDGIVRMGRVRSVARGRVELDQGTIEIDADAVVVDCSASAIPNRTVKPVFAGNTITPQTVRAYQPVFSAAFIAHVALAYPSETLRNQLCAVVPLPDTLTDWLHMTAANYANQFRWSQDPELRRWLRGNRLDGFAKISASIDPDDIAKRAIIARLREHAGPALANLQRLAAAA